MPEIFKKLKHLFVIIALTGILMQNFSKVIIFLNFQLNKEYIAKNLCIKKNERNNCCKGKCHLKKQLIEDDKKEKSSSSSTIKEVKEVQLYCQQKLPFGFVNLFFIQKLNTSFQAKELGTIRFSVFHPPQA